MGSLRLPTIVRAYVGAILKKDPAATVVAAGALRRVAAQKERVAGGLADQVLDHLEAIERGDKKLVRDTFVSMAGSVGVKAEVDDELGLVEGEGQG